MYVCMYVWVCIYIYIYIYMYVHVYMYMCVVNGTDPNIDPCGTPVETGDNVSDVASMNWTNCFLSATSPMNQVRGIPYML